MGGHAALAGRAVRTMTGGVDLANDTFADQAGERSCSWAALHCFDDAHEFMAQHALEGHIATYNLQVGVANTRVSNANQGFAFNRSWYGIVAVKYKVSVPVNQCTHEIPPRLLFSIIQVEDRLNSPLLQLGSNRISECLHCF